MALAALAVALLSQAGVDRAAAAPRGEFSTFLGGGGPQLDDALGIAVDPQGYTYVTGRAGSADFPTTPGAFDTTHNGNFDGFVAKLSRDGSALIYATFIGGESIDEPTGIAVDQRGHAYVVGSTDSDEFPATPGAFDTTHDGPHDAFVAKLSRDGSALEYASLIGGSDFDFGGNGIAVDPRGQAYVTGHTSSADFPTTADAFDTTRDGTEDAFAVRLTRDGSALGYSTLLGGGMAEFGGDVAVDPSGDAYLTGTTESADFPTTAGAFDTSYGGSFDAFVAELDSDGSALAYSTYLGGPDTDIGQGVAVQSGEAYVSGRTSSNAFPVTAGAFDTTYGGGFSDGFITRLGRDGSDLVFSTFLGGGFDDDAAGIAIDPQGHAYVTGFTQSAEFPTTPGAFDTTLDFIDAFATRFARDGSAVDYSSFIGGSAAEFGHAIATGASRAAHVGGGTASPDFPTTPGAFDTTFAGGFFDGFVTKLETR